MHLFARKDSNKVVLHLAFFAVHCRSHESISAKSAFSEARLMKAGYTQTEITNLLAIHKSTITQKHS